MIKAPFTVEPIDLTDHDSYVSLKHALYGDSRLRAGVPSRDWARAAVVMLAEYIASELGRDESEGLSKWVAESDDDEWLQSAGLDLLERARELALARWRAAFVAAWNAREVVRQVVQVVDKEVLERDPASGLIKKTRETTRQ